MLWTEISKNSHGWLSDMFIDSLETTDADVGKEFQEYIDKEVTFGNAMK